MLRILFSVVLVCGLSACAQITPKQSFATLAALPADKDYQYEDLPFGYHGFLDLDEHVIALPSGNSYYAAYALPKTRGGYYLQLRTYIQKTAKGDGYFYPVIELRDQNKKLIETVKTQLRFTQQSRDGLYAAIPIQVTAATRYIVIRSEPKLFGQEASYSTDNQGATWSYTASPFDKSKPATYLPFGGVELLTPDAGQSVPFEKLTGPYWQFSLQQGTARLAKTDQYIPDVTLAGGAIFSLGYALKIPGRPFGSLRTQVGLGYYSMEDKDGFSNTEQFTTADALWVESNQVASLGLGVTYTGSHTWQHAGDEVQFEAALGPKMIIEMRGAMGVTLGAGFSWMTYKTKDGDSQRNNQWSISLTRFF
ncbi:MAG: hypothetical protein H7A08_04200 [Oceanospirillaceae bacterium]|nr:hypothetical protein [Oceanospirillaceae bacterium]MCP5349551.1 hypothetical protein [Oceanospirillaceae bacterium]